MQIAAQGFGFVGRRNKGAGSGSNWEVLMRGMGLKEDLNENKYLGKSFRKLMRLQLSRNKLILQQICIQSSTTEC